MAGHIIKMNNSYTVCFRKQYHNSLRTHIFGVHQIDILGYTYLSEPGALGTRIMPPAGGDGIIFESAISSSVTVVLGNCVTPSRSGFVVDEIIGYSSSSGNAVRRRILCVIVRFTDCALPLHL